MKSETQEGVVLESAAISVQARQESPAEQAIGMLGKAVDSGLDADSIEKLVNLQRDMAADYARQQFAEAMTHVQMELPPVYRGHENKQTSSKYAKIEDLQEILHPIACRHGFTTSFGEGDSPIEGNRRWVGTLRHSAGHSEQYHIDLPPDDTGIKGMKNKTGVHGVVSSISYARRTLLGAMFDVVYTNEDDDGQGGNVETITEQQALDLAALIEEVGADKGAFLTWLRVASLEDVPATSYHGAVAALERKRSK